MYPEALHTCSSPGSGSMLRKQRPATTPSGWYPHPTCWPEKQIVRHSGLGVWGESGMCLHPGQLGQPQKCSTAPPRSSESCKLGRFCVQMFLLIRSVSIYHPLLNELHSSTIDHHYPSIIKTNILQISYVPALHSLWLGHSLFLQHSHSPPLTFKELIDSLTEWAEIHFPHMLNGNLQTVR